MDVPLTERVAVFLRAGIAAPAVHRFHRAATTGIVATGLWPGRPRDRVGLGIAHAENGADYLETERAAGSDPTAAETAVELNYRWELGHGMVIQPDLQIILNPDTQSTTENATVFATRFEFNF